MYCTLKVGTAFEFEHECFEGAKLIAYVKKGNDARDVIKWKIAKDQKSNYQLLVCLNENYRRPQKPEVYLW